MQKSFVEPPLRPLLPEQLSFLAIINFILRQLPIMLVLGVIASTIFFVRAYLAPVTWSSTSIVATGDEAAGNRILSFLGGGTSFSNQGSQAYVDLLSAPVVLEQLTRVTFDFPDGRKTALAYYGGNIQPPDRALETAMGEVSNNISARVKDPSGWVEITTKGKTAVLAQQLNLAVIAQLDSFNAQKRRKVSLENQKFAEDRLVELGASVRIAENRYQAFLERNKDLTPPSLQLERDRLADSLARVKSLYSAILTSYDRERLEAERQAKTLTIIGRPNLPYSPSSRGIGRTVILGIFAGAFLGALIGIVREYFGGIRKQASPEYAEFMALLSRWFGRLRPRRKPA